MKRIICYTLFNITQTGVRNRNRPSEDVDPAIWLTQRNTQCNFDTILQAVSMRSQPELISTPKRIDIKFNEFENFGFLFQQIENETYPCWKFEFTVQHPNVFNDGKNELGALYNDCHGIPMLHVNDEWDKLPNFLDGSDELRNIYFEIQDN